MTTMAFPEIEQTETQWTLWGQSVMRSENITVMSGTVTRYRIGTAFEVSASRDGVMVECNNQIHKREDMIALHAIINQAWEDAKRHSGADRFGGKVQPP
jgi:hypothetical protein